MRVVFACAGSGGHINPAIAIANNLKRRDEKTEVLFIGRENEMENNLVKNHGYENRNIRTDRILRKITFKNIRALITNLNGLRDAKKIIKEFKPDLVIGTGGFVCVPVMLAAKSLKIKYMLHESNAFPGLSVKVTAKNSSGIMVGFNEAKDRLKSKTENITYTGTPIKFSRESYEKLNKESCRKELDIPLDKKVILITGGSQGARIFSELLTEIFSKNKDSKELDNCYYILISGNGNFDLVNNLLKEKGVDNAYNLKILPFVYDMEKMYKAADLAITRAGALTITELITTKLPSILIPLPYAAENHQLFNANAIKAVDGAEVIEEKNLNADVLFNTVNNIVLDEEKLKKMQNGLNEKYINDVDDKIYNSVKKVLEMGE